MQRKRKGDRTTPLQGSGSNLPDRGLKRITETPASCETCALSGVDALHEVHLGQHVDTLLKSRRIVKMKLVTTTQNVEDESSANGCVRPSHAAAVFGHLPAIRKMTILIVYRL